MQLLDLQGVLVDTLKQQGLDALPLEIDLANKNSVRAAFKSLEENNQIIDIVNSLCRYS